MTPREQIEGAYIRWWPRGRRDEQRYIDGTMRDGRFVTIEHIGPTWSSRDGFIGDLVDVQTKGGLAFIDRPIPLRADPTLKPDEFRIESGGDTMRVIGIDFGSEPSTTVVATKCARCDVTFQGEGSIDELTAHAERCFVVHDYVRWEADNGDYAEGELVAPIHRPELDLVADIMVERSNFLASGHPCGLGVEHGVTLRRIQRPGQHDPTEAAARRVFAEQTSRDTSGVFSLDAMLDEHYPRDENGKHYIPAPPKIDLSKIRKTAPATKREWVKPVARDPTSGYYVPATPDEWHEILKSAGVHESILASGPLIYQQTVTGWNSKHVGTMHVEVTGDPTGSTGWQPAGIPLEPPPRPDGFDPESIAAIKRELLKPVVKVKR